MPGAMSRQKPPEAVSGATSSHRSAPARRRPHCAQTSPEPAEQPENPGDSPAVIAPQSRGFAASDPVSSAEAAVRGFHDAIGPERTGGPSPAAVTRLAFLSVKQFATVVGLSDTTVLRRIRDGQIRSTRIGRLWRIPISEVGRLLG